MTEETIKQIFEEIDQAMERTKSEVPVPIKDSKFLIEYIKIKEKYLK